MVVEINTHIDKKNCLKRASILGNTDVHTLAQLQLNWTTLL